MNIRCLLGMHRWVQSREQHVTDIHILTQQNELTRKCTRCGKSQYWLSGCGGSELGSWESDD